MAILITIVCVLLMLLALWILVRHFKQAKKGGCAGCPFAANGHCPSEGGCTQTAQKENKEK